MLDRSIAAADSTPLKNSSFRRRLGFAAGGILHVWKHEKSFRTQSSFALATLVLLTVVRPPLIWWAIVTLVTALVLALELMNAALEYVCDRLHPGLCEAIKHAKDAAAGAVLLASIAAVTIGCLLLMTEWLR